MKYFRILLVQTILFCTIGVQAQTEAKDSVWRRTLVVTTTDNQAQEFVLERGTHVGTIGAFLEVANADSVRYFMLNKIKRMNYSRKQVPTSIETVISKELQEIPFQLSDDGELTLLSQICEGATVSIYDLSGRIVSSSRSTGNGRITLSLTAQPAGVYILIIDRQSYKIQKP